MLISMTSSCASTTCRFPSPEHLHTHANTDSCRQQGRDVWTFLEQAWNAHHHGGVMPSLLPKLPLELQKP